MTREGLLPPLGLGRGVRLRSSFPTCPAVHHPSWRVKIVLLAPSGGGPHHPASTALLAETWPHLRSQEACAWGAFHSKAQGQLPPTSLGLWKMGPVLSYVAFGERAEFKLKGRPNWLLPLSIAFAVRCWKYLVHPFPSKPGPEKGPPACAAASASIAHLQGLSAAWDQRASLFPRTRLALAKGQKQIQEYLASRLRDCLSPPTPSTLTRARLHVGTHTAERDRIAGRLRRRNGAEYGGALERPSPHPGPLETRCEGLCGAQRPIQGRGKAAQAGPVWVIPEGNRKREQVRCKGE
ncbi:hypothetical protein HJG60_009529 [Phyllostomus discolor]|uniref:Uncharacterized protein n=1 Tax=Phyllostomus discolor TaxID=89673 RepID=A0A833YGB1_9CHIR|nr:hypothetical protein HJG60_009529 [Phyllostomus discolor]